VVSLLPPRSSKNAQPQTTPQASHTMHFESSFGTVDSLEPIHNTNTMAESNAWKEGVSMTAGLAGSNQMNLSGLASSQHSHTHSPSIQKPNNLQVNIIINNRTNGNGAYNNQKSLGGDAGSNVPVSQSSNRLPSPFDLSFDDALGGFPNYINNQTNSQSNLSNPTMKAPKNGISQPSHDFQHQQSGQVPSQPQHVSSLSNMLSSWQTADQYSSLGGGNDSSTLLTMGNKESTSNTSQRTTNKIISNRFLLGSKVQPFTRNDEEIVDDDLFKVFDDDLGSHASRKLQMVRRYTRWVCTRLR